MKGSALVAAARGLLDAVVRTAAAIALVAVIVVVFANVIARYVFNDSFVWSEELAQHLFIAIIFLGVPLAHRQQAHLTIDWLEGRLPPGLLPFLDVLNRTIVAYTTVLLFSYGLQLIDLIGGATPALDWPNWIKYVPILVGAGASLLYLAILTRTGPIAVAAGLALWWLLDVRMLLAFDTVSPSVIMIGAFAVTLVMGVPVAFAMLFAAFVANLGGTILPPVAVIQTAVKGSSQFLLLAIPFFLAAGMIMNLGGLSQRLMDLAFALVGHLRGGFAQVNVLTSALYGGISGSSAADAALDSKLLVPQMVRNGYSAEFSCAITACSAILPNVIPPSIAMLILGSIANISIGDLFVAGIGAGALIAVTLFVTVYVVSLQRGYGGGTPRAGGGQIARAVWQALPVLALAAIIIVGIRGGAITPTEAGVVAVVYALVLGMGIYRAFGWRELWDGLVESAMESAMVGILIGAAAPFAWILIAEEIPQQFVQFTLAFTDSRFGVLLLLNALMLLAGMFISLTASILILVPVFLPLMAPLGVDPVHFGIIVVVNMMIGGVTPPVGYLVFITASVSRTPVHLVFRECMLFIGPLLAALALITYVPVITMGLVWLTR